MVPTAWPTAAPTASPTDEPTSSPTPSPTKVPTPAPTVTSGTVASGTVLQSTVALAAAPGVALHLWTSVDLNDLTVQVQATADGLPPVLAAEVEKMKMNVAL